MTTINIAVVDAADDPVQYAVVTVRLIAGTSGGAVEERVIAGWTTVHCDADGEGTIALTPNEDISPAGSYYAFHVEQSSPAVVRCIEVPDSGTALSWADPSIQVLPDDPPVFIPAPTLANALKVMRVNSSGDAYELGTAGAGDVAGDTHAATSKTTPVDADELPLADSAASFALKKLTWANLKATAKTYFDTLYAAASHAHAGSDITSGTIATARLGSGTANSGTYLRGDQTWAAVSGGSTVDVVSNVANNVLLGRTTAGSGDSEELAVAASRLVGRAASGDIDDLDAAAVKAILALAVGDVSGAAPLADPTFTGTPVAPTAAQGTSTTQVATTAFATKSSLRPRLPGAIGSDSYRIGSNMTMTLGRIFWVPMPVFDIDVKATNAWIDLVTGQASCYATMALTGCVSATNDAPGVKLASTSVGAVDLTSASPNIRGAAFSAAYTIPAGTRTWMQVIALGGTAPTARGIDGQAFGMPTGTPATAPVTPITFGTTSAYLLSSQTALVDTPTITGLSLGVGPVVHMSIEAP